MFKCVLCGYEADNRRQMHGHMMRNHYQDYKDADFDMDNITEGAPLRAHVAQALKDYPRPAGFRRLRSYTSTAEARAILAGYMFVDDQDNLYTEAEARGKSWI